MLDIPPAALIPVTNKGKHSLKCGEVVLMPGVPVMVPYSFLSEYGSNSSIQPDFSAFGEHLRSQTDDGRPYFDFWAPLSAVDGYGRHAIDLWRGFGLIGAQVPFRSVGLEDDVYLDHSFIGQVHDNRRMPPAKTSVTFSVPYDAHHSSGASVHRISISQFETDWIPKKHIENLNKAHHLIVTSSFQPNIWRKSGLKIPISVMTPGIDPDIFTAVERPRVGLFRCLILGALSGRKNGAAAIRIFQAASQGDPGWRLTIKNRGGLDHITPAMRDQIRSDGRINFVHGDTSPMGVVDLYHQHDCLLWPSKGEGVGLPPLEAMSTGMEVVISDSSGMKDYIDSKHCWPIKIRGQESARLDGTYPPDYIVKFGDVGSWWLPDENHAVKQLQKAFQAWYDHKGKGALAADYVRSHHTLQHQAQSVLRVVEEYQ